MKSSGRGIGALYLFVAKLTFLFTGYLIYFSLSRLLEIHEFGLYGIVTSIINVIDMFLITGTVQAVSKFVSEDSNETGKIQRGALILQSLFGGGSFLLLNIFAPLLSRLFKDQNLLLLLRISSFVPLFYSFYCIFIGTLNGRKDFKLQGLFDITYSFLKTGLVVGMTFLFGSVFSALSGFSIASLFILLLAVWKVGVEKGGSPFPVKKIFRFEFFIILMTLFVYLTMNTDIYLLKVILDKEEGARYAGFYTAVYSLSRIPFQLSIPVTLIVFPYISESTHRGRDEDTRRYMVRAFFFSSLFLVYLSIFISQNAEELLGILYPARYGEAIPPLRIAPYGTIFFTLFYLSVTIISGSGRPGRSVILSLIAVPLNFVLSGILIPRYGMIGAAWGTTISMSIIFMISNIFLFFLFRFSFPISNFLYIIVPSIISLFILRAIPSGLFFLSVKFLIETVLFLPFFLSDHEITSRIRRLLSRKR